MSRLKILMADDQQTEVEDARRALKEMAHDVISVSTFDKAMEIAQHETFDIAVVDLGWYTDKELKKKKMNDEDIGSAGWRILELIRANNPDTVRILYSARTDEPKITQAATEQNIYCVQKEFSPEGRLHLADVVKVIAHRLSIENQLREKINAFELELQKSNAKIHKLETSIEKAEIEHQISVKNGFSNKIEMTEAELEKARSKIVELEKAKNDTNSEKLKFNRLLIAVLVVPTAAFILFITAWLITQQLLIAILAFVGGSFLLLALLLAIRAISLTELKYMGELLQSLFPKSGTG